MTASRTPPAKLTAQEIADEVARVLEFIELMKKEHARRPLPHTSKMYRSEIFQTLYLRLRKGSQSNAPSHRGVPPLDSLAIANVELFEGFHGQGILKALLASLELPGALVRFEQVHNPHLVQHLLKRGYARELAPEGTYSDPNFWVLR